MSEIETEAAEFQQALDTAGEQPSAEPPAEEPTATPSPEQELRSFGGQLLAGRFKTPEELERGYNELQQRLGEMGNELGQLRQYVQQPQPAAPAPLSAEQVSEFDDFAADNPYQAAEYARQAQNPLLWERALQAWHEQDPRAAGRYERALEWQQMQAQQQAQLAQLVTPLQQQAQAQALQAAWHSTRSRYPDLDQHSEAMLQAAERAPQLLYPLQYGTPDDKQRVFETLYYMARGMQGQQVPASASEPAGLAQRVAATITAGTTAPQQTRPLTEEDKLRALFDEAAGFTT